ncbi:DUF202 domain-containing protein [Diaphorobacter caeni]|uniref:DUF202 domain-containing protein n=1 Tax=Diaphorobacter caeni TaxID=2784387 RepID=UPI0018900A07|nr:DUF202 domain-containing protein [Diaphorobacter caeni]MBF5007316.1 hypothetical protein [Diaphorobacter caeni]
MTQPDKGLQFERTDLAQRRTALVTLVLMTASLRFVATHGGVLQLPLLVSTIALGAASLFTLRPGLLAQHRVVNFGRHFQWKNLILCASTAQIAVNVLL